VWLPLGRTRPVNLSYIQNHSRFAHKHAENGFFHADPHAGNLLACPDGRLCYLDFGMMSYANSSQRNGFVLAVVHIVNRDWAELVRLYQRLGFIPEGTDLKPIEVALENALPDVLNADITELNFKNVVSKLGDVSL
jgi:predicted unusual protein kinase regulating ubiquinone biosynthesis (AarF/ABC1/UbiB family)